MEKIIELKNVKKIYHMGNEKIKAVNGVSFEINKGEFCCLLGTSGSGKSTLLNLMAGIEKASSGEILLKGYDIRNMSEKNLADFRQHYLGFVFQAYNLIGSMNAIENVEMPLVFKRVDSKTRRRLAEQMLIQVGLGSRLTHKPKEMSGGQQQRVAVARALVMNPEVLLLDEPLSNLDAKLRESVRVELREIQKKMGLSTIYVTHDQSEALSMSDMIVVLKGGVVHQTGSPQEIYFEPKTPFVADFIGTTNLLSVKGLGENTVSYGNDRIPTTKSVNAGQEYCLSIRPECLKLVKEAVDGQVNVKVTIQNKMFLGEKIRYFVNDSLGKEWIIDIYDPGRTILEGEAYAAFPFEKAWLIEDLTD